MKHIKYYQMTKKENNMICLVVYDECDEDEIHFLELDDELVDFEALRIFLGECDEDEEQTEELKLLI